MQILAFDFGTKKIGVAVGQTLTKTSSPLSIIFNHGNRINWPEIEEVLDEWKPELILVGKPLNMDGTESDIMKTVESFVKKLSKISKIKCEYVDERLTSFEAREKVADIGSTLVDAHAAKIILDNWFNKSVDIVGRRIQLTKKGQNFWCLCPFHDDKKPSMAVNQDKQFFYCFVCNASGNSIHFLRRYENLDFVDAVETIASSVGLEVPYTKQTFEESKAKEINDEANIIYKSALKSSDGSEDVKYLKNRGISGETAAFFNLGYAKDGWTNLYDKVTSKYPKADILESGLFSTKEEKIFDFFRARLMFPIRNIRGQCVAFGGRILGDGEPKYLNSPETKTYSKSNELFGLYEARELNKSLDSLIVVEGYMDVIALHQNGVKNAVASLGTAITAKHVSKLMRYAKNIYVAFDGDLAGRKAAWKAVENALPILREDVKIGFIFLEEGHDPDSYINEKGKEAFLRLLDNNISFSKFFLSRIKKVDDLETIEGRSKAAKFAIPLVNSINNETLKQAYIEEIASISLINGVKISVS